MDLSVQIMLRHTFMPDDVEEAGAAVGKGGDVPVGALVGRDEHLWVRDGVVVLIGWLKPRTDDQSKQRPAVLSHPPTCACILRFTVSSGWVTARATPPAKPPHSAWRHHCAASSVCVFF